MHLFSDLALLAAMWVFCEWWQDGSCTMSLSYLQRRLQQNEEDFARISEIDLEKNSIKETPKK